MRWEKPGGAVDALLADEPNNGVVGVDVPDTLQATIISIGDYRKAQQSDEEVCDIKNRIEILSDRGVLRPKGMVIADGVLYYQVIEEANGVLEAIKSIYVPKSLRGKVLENTHNSVWGVHILATPLPSRSWRRSTTGQT